MLCDHSNSRRIRLVPSIFAMQQDAILCFILNEFKVPPPQAYLQISCIPDIQTCNVQIKSNSVKRRMPPLLPIHNPIPPILNPIRLPSVLLPESQRTPTDIFRQRYLRHFREPRKYPINDIQMIDIRDSSLIFSPNSTLHRHETIIFSLLDFNNIMTTPKDRTPRRSKGSTEGKVTYILSVRT